jgi:2-oxoglutarate dehydrogenase E1 component
MRDAAQAASAAMVDVDDALLLSGNSRFVEELFTRYSQNPQSVDPSWRQLFQDMGAEAVEVIGEGRARASWAREDWPTPAGGELTAALDAGLEMPLAAKVGAVAPQEDVRGAILDSIRALMMIRTYRVRGHLIARLDPLGLEERTTHLELNPATYGFGPEDLDRPIFIDHVLGLESATLREILEILHRTYCSTIGVEFMHINVPEEKGWIQERIEGREKEVSFTQRGKLAILQKLTEAEVFERFLNTKYTGTKRFGLDGGEALIPAMEQIIKRGGHLGVREIVLGMPHRGRLNVLTNVMQKPFQAIFHEFHGGSSSADDVQGSGDVKYHLGTSADREFDGNLVHLSLTANPSHLEAVDPLVLGKVRAKQVQHNDYERTKVMSILMHGDAAFAGQGLVAECFGLSQLKGYRTGGTIHLIVNNQIGFTTSPKYSRSSPYPSDTAKMVQAPIFHVNGDDPEAVVHVCKVATEFRQRFKKDVVVDMFCYRRHGHNESDEPAFTQPLMYRKIAQHPTTRQIYARRLIGEGLISEEGVEAMVAAFHDTLEKEFQAAQSFQASKADWLSGRWSSLKVATGAVRRGETAVAKKVLKKIGKALTSVPEGFQLHRTLQRLMNNKRKMFEPGGKLDWATAEALAFGSLIEEGNRVRLSGQDSGRGTFSQRHSVLVDQGTEERFIPLNTLGEGDGFEVIDSMLSEAAVLGFEYGYSQAEPDCLVLWEAQFGDFANGAQVIIDQFISSSERKWLRMSGLVMLLPHGYEGQGPEHSSARLERYLQLCAEDNMQVANCSTPASYFHILRRQLRRNFRKPLIIMTPKSLLRHKRCVSRLEDLSSGSSFHRVLWDDAQSNPDSSITLASDEEISRVILCTGKVYYDLLEERDRRGQTDAYLLRLEQLYPFPHRALVEELSRFKNATVIWCQEESKNMGAWNFLAPCLEEVLSEAGHACARPIYAGRPASASPATGLMSRHIRQQKALITAALG